ncbi:MAG: hypothetical protein ABSB35_14765 [Bryobacteraceae bacterium]
MKRAALGIIAIALMNAQPSQDPADLLEQMRDKVVARLPTAGYACVATINRSYFSRPRPPVTQRSCEQIAGDRKRNRDKVQLDKTDRLRLKVVMTSGREIYSWAWPGAYSRSVNDILQSGPIGTGALGSHLHEIFGNPLVRFRLLDENEKNLSFGFRVPVEASTYLIWARSQWRAAGYVGSLEIDLAAPELKQLTIESDELPPETTMCEASTTLDYPSGGAGVLLPSKARTRYLIRDTTETEWDTAFSDCRDSTSEKVQEGPRRTLFPPTWAVPFKLALTAPIETSTAAAGDVIKARLAEPMLGPSREVLAPAGAIFTGRIMRLEHHLDRKGLPIAYMDKAALTGRRFFLIWVDFDAIEVNGVVSSIRARLTCDHPGPRCFTANMSDQIWDRAFIFPTDDPNFIVPAGYESSWLTGFALPKE